MEWMRIRRRMEVVVFRVFVAQLRRVPLHGSDS